MQKTAQNRLPFDEGILHPEESADETLSRFSFHNTPEEYNLAFGVLDAYRIKINHIYDKLTSVSNSRTRLLPHQIEATHRIVNSIRPRFILADEVGLGKTIEAGLIMKELILRKGYERVFVAVPAPLVVQWQQEMKNKFNEEFTIVSRRNFSQVAASWQKHKKIITSIDFIKNEKYANEALQVKWDVVVFDEAHRLRRDYSKVTRSYTFAEKISQKAGVLLLLSATPFRGKLEELFYLIRLVDPHILGPYSSFIQEYTKENTGDLREKISKVLVRRRKVEVGGFTKRFATTIRFDLSPDERIFYDETTNYVRREYNLAMQQQNRAVGFVMIVFQKLLDSSTRALLRALERRKIMLEQRIHGPSLLMQPDASFETEFDPDAFDDCEDPDVDFDSIENRTLRSIRDTRKELMTINHLLSLGRRIKTDRKLQRLKETLLKLKKEGHKKFIIFTQFRSTQEYIAEQLDMFQVTQFHGSLNMQQKEDAIQEFRNTTEILICTEAGGEGRNLQFGNVLINYDLPWSPLKIEQRIGRIHRFGQAKDVYIFNFSTRDTVAERVLEVLEEKIKLFEESIGASDPLLGAVEDETDFEGKFMQFVTGVKTKKEFDQELQDKLRLAESGYRKLNELVTPACVDFNLDDYYDYTRKRRSVDNNDIEELTLNYLALVNRSEFMLQRVDDPSRRAEYNLLQNGAARPATFRSEVALENDSIEFLANGHPLVETAIRHFLNHPGRRSIQLFPAQNGLATGYYFIYLCRFLNGLSRTELLSCLVPEQHPTRPVIPDEILIPAGIRFEKLPPGFGYNLDITGETEAIEKARTVSEAALQIEVDSRAEKLKERTHSVFKKEEYKLEISYGKKLRQIDEKRDRHKLAYRMNPTSETRAVLTRTENEFMKAKQEMEEHIRKVRSESRIETRLQLLQVYRIVKSDIQPFQLSRNR